MDKVRIVNTDGFAKNTRVFVGDKEITNNVMSINIDVNTGVVIAYVKLCRVEFDVVAEKFEYFSEPTTRYTIENAKGNSQDA